MGKQERMKTGKRGTYAWLAMLGFAVTLVVAAIAAGSVALGAEFAVGLILVYLAIAFYALAGNTIRNFRLPGAPALLSAARATPAARRATQRARARPGFNSDVTLTDVGLIVNERRPDGRWNRHLAQSVSMDEDAIQPYVTISVPPESSHRLALITFEIYDQSGRPQFSRQVEQWVRDGDNSVICDRQLPLAGNDALGRSGVWDLRVTMDGALLAIHSFSVTPPDVERRRHFTSEGEAIGDRLAAAQDDAPLSLEELLREQRGHNRD